MFQAIIDKILLKDNDKGSYSLTMTIISFIVINIKLLFSGSDIGHLVHFSDFSGTEFGIALAAVASLHLGNKVVNNSNNTKEVTKVTVEETKDGN